MAASKSIDEWLDRIGVFPITEGRRLHGLKEARDRGYTHYWAFTEREGMAYVTPCKHGHIAPRYVENRVCLECNAMAAAASRRRSKDITIQNRDSVS